ncbi:MAG TPA: Uma2 family endonuclease [Thermoanaerobaculia bacterium]|nr:Uma2 family endonuclease [Thermoanaerobaculia bacterium]
MAIRDTARRKLSYEDYLLFPEDGKRHEILDGEHYVTAAPYPKHQRVLGELHFWLRFFLQDHRLGQVYLAPTDILLSEHDIVQPDLLFICNERLTILKEKNVQGAPDLVVEVLSDSTRRMDEGIKLARYERCGVREYWVVDPARNEARVFRRLGERLRKVADLSAAAGDALTSPLLPGLEIPLAEIFQ